MKATDQPTRKFWNVVSSKDGRTATIDLFGELMDDRTRDMFAYDDERQNYYTPRDFTADLAAVASCDEVVVNINSVGGDVFVGLAIRNAIRELPCKVITRVQGIAASAASIIFCAGDVREVYSGSLLMLHSVSCWVAEAGYLNENGLDEAIRRLRSTRDALKTMNDAVASIYAGATGKDKETCLKYISGDTETWMTGAEAIEEGFATGYAPAEDHHEPLKLVACGGKTALYSGSLLLSDNFRAPQNAAELGITSSSAPAAEEEKQETNTNMDTETKDTIEAAPTATDTAAVAAQARKAERERISAVNALADKLGGRVNKELVNRALYGDADHDAMTPEQFAVEAVMALSPEAPAQTEAKPGETYLNLRAAELAAADAVNTAAPAEAHDADSDNNGLRILARLASKAKK